MGKKIHALATKLGFGCYLYVNNALIHMYAPCGSLDFAVKFFMRCRSDIYIFGMWFIANLTRMRRFFCIFHEMQQANFKADAVTMVKVLFACKQLGDRVITDSMTKFIKDNSVETDVYLGNTLIDMYGENGLLDFGSGSVQCDAWIVKDRISGGS